MCVCVRVCVCVCVCVRVCLCVCPCQGEARQRSLKHNTATDMNHLMEDNGLPVHIKGGTFDVVLYRATMTLTLGGNRKKSTSLAWKTFMSPVQNQIHKPDNVAPRQVSTAFTVRRFISWLSSFLLFGVQAECQDVVDVSLGMEPEP
ncbi:uncharacterized protein LOC117938717 [Etheostoma cragini]|uniref:uncharacterized protein LOC117938717 n=1 Tax=Etheostoma cragini TaxID=417921 RepID=UPI00155E68B0|nr:uncharacterized protein LOC117938717 [Etheostoma cragini]